MTVDVGEVGGAHGAVLVAARATEGTKELATLRREVIACRLQIEPARKALRFHCDHRPMHLRVLRSAELGAEKLINPGLRRLEPHARRHARHGVLFDPERGHEEGVNDVLAGKLDDDRLTDRYMQFINLPLPAWMLKAPHPLFSQTEDVQRVRGW